jgi:nitrate ABC transporter ATP-binding subunit
MNASVTERYLELWRLSKTFPGPQGPVTIVQEFNLSVRQGEFVSLIGHSGCGKSTVLSIVAGLQRLTTGGIILAGREIIESGPDRGVVFQAPCLLPWLTAFENVKLGVDEVFPGKTSAERGELVAHYLELVGLKDALHKRPAELSQGMRQRVGLGRAFALDPKVLLLDEPFGMLDSLTRCELQEVLMELWAGNQKTALMVTHDVDEALLLSDRVVMMTNGPAATVGDIVEVTLPRPRERVATLEHPNYFGLRERLIGFLEEQDRRHVTPGSEHSQREQTIPTTATTAPADVPATTNGTTTANVPSLASG